MYSVNNNLDKFKDDDIFDTTNPFYQLLEKQATEFELFGQRLKSDIQNSYREFIKFQRKQQRNQEIAIDSKLDDALEKVSKDVNDSQSELIDSLRARIEELETDSKSEIRRLKQELNEFKSNLMLLFDQNTMFPQSDHKRIKDIFEKFDNNAEDDISIGDEKDEDIYSTKDWVKGELEESIKFSIPWAFYRFINGKGGYLVNQIQNETKTNITIGNPIVIRGTKDGIETARKRLEDIVESANKPRNEKSDTSNTKTKGGKGGKRRVESFKDSDNKEGFEENITIRFNISQHLRGAIFGRGGKILNQITDETRTKIKIQPNGDTTISGTRDRVEMAKRRIEDIIAENERLEKDHVIKDSKRPEENISARIKIPLSLVGPVIGRGGKTLNQIRDETQTKIKIQSNGDSTIIGTRDGVEMAKKRIETIMETVHKADNNKKSKDIDTESIYDDKEDDGEEFDENFREEFDENTEIKLSMVPMAPTTFNDLLSKD